MFIKRLCLLTALIFIGVFVPTALFATPPQPTYGTAVVDGNYSEWDLTNDFFANMYRAGDPGKALESKAYLRWDGATHTMYVLVLAEPGIPALATGWEAAAWSAINTISNKVYTGSSGNDGTPPDFAWVGLSGDGLTAAGYEASFTIDPGTYSIIIHIEVFDDSDSQTSASAGFPREGLPLVIIYVPPVYHPAISLEKYVSVDGGVTWVEADTSPWPQVLVGKDVYYKFVVTNTGDVALTDITLTDSTYDLSGCTIPSSLAAGVSFECVIGPFPATYGLNTNTATATGDFEGNTYNDTDDASYFGTLCTYTQGGYQGRGVPGSILDSYLFSVFPSGLEVGDYFPGNGTAVPNGYLWEATATGKNNLKTFLAKGGPSGPITNDALNPTTSSSGTLPRQAVALTLNIGFSGVVPGMPAGFGGLYYCNPGDPLSGQTVSQLLAAANNALAGLGLPAGYTFGSLNTLITNLNEAFDNGTATMWAQTYLLTSCP